LSAHDSPTIAGRGTHRTGPGAGETWRLATLFGALAFLQGVGEPTDGLLAQPVRSLLRRWGEGAGAIAAFTATLGLPWILKPLYGLLCDFVPLLGTRRKGYLVLAGGATTVALFSLFALPTFAGRPASLLIWLLIPSVAVAMADVAADALMIERGQPTGLTGLLQAVQWGSLYSAGIVNGLLGGLLSEYRRETWAFFVCGIGGLLTTTLALVGVREPRRPPDRPRSRAPLSVLAGALRSGASPVLAVGGFLMLWNFNPFSNVVLHLHMTRGLGFSERFYGVTVALTAVASIAASVAYGFYCRRVPMRTLVHASIVLGIVSTLGYAAVTDERSAVVVTLVVGVTYMTATLIQLDLAARACPPELAGTLFAILMSLENLGASVSTGLGGLLYDQGVDRWGSRRAFEALVLVGAAFTTGCWLLVPFLPEDALTSNDQQ
jgi:MFS family permease